MEWTGILICLNPVPAVYSFIPWKKEFCVCVCVFLISWETTISKSCSHGHLTAHSHVYTRDGKVNQSSKVLTKSANKGVTVLCHHLGYKCKPQPSLYTCY